MSATLAARVKAARDAAGLSQRQLPGVDSGLLSRIETGKVKDPAISTLTAIAKATGTTVDQLNGAPASAVRSIELRDLHPDPKNPRVMQEGDAADQAFMQSIKDQGLIQPLAVRRALIDNAMVWMVVDGHRRYAALVQIHGPRSKVLVPCRVIEADDTQTLLLQLVANVQRADMNPWDLSRAIGDLVDQKMDTQAIADALGRKRRWVQEMASVGRHLGESGSTSLQTGALSISQAVAVAAERDDERQRSLVARVLIEGLNEDEIRAIIADGKAKEKEAADNRQLDIEGIAPGDAKTYPTANDHGVFDCKPTVEAKWVHKRGHVVIKLVQYGEHKWCAGLTVQWRNDGKSHLPGRDDYKQQNAPVCFLDVARTAFSFLCDKAEHHPEDLPALRQAHEWVATQLAQLGATERVKADWRNNNKPPEPPKKAEPPAKTKPAPAPKAPKIDTNEPPEWARPMVGALFMYHNGRAAWLCKGWRHMVKTFIADRERGVDEEVRDLYSRASWANNAAGEPFDFGGSVVRLWDAPA